MTALPELGYGRTWPDADTFGVLARDRRVIPVVRRLMADAETPLSVYRKLAKGEPGTFLLESAEQGVWSRWSIIGARSRATLTERDGEALWIGEPPAGVPTTGSPVEVLRATLEALRTEPVEGLPPLTSGMVGAISYDAVRRWERVPATLPDVLGVPEVGMVLATDVAVLDHSDGSLILIANAINYDDTDERVDQAYDVVADAMASVTSDVTPERYQEIVEEAKEDIRAGEVFQVVLSQRFSMDCPADPTEVYRALRAANPSPYMYFFRLPRADGSTYDVVGGSPEELLADPKERSEHVMLVDLGRNDLQRVCEAGTVDCLELMDVRRYSHVTHLESTVVGRMRPEVSAYDVLVSTFPAGTLSGAPKPRALALIEHYERSRRGVYGGVVGYLDFHGDMDMAIAIRTALVVDGRAHVQAGAGIVADSVPHLEHAECVAKAGAALRAVATAGAMRTVGPTQRGHGGTA